MISYFKWTNFLVIILLLMVTDLIICSNEGITCGFELNFCGWKSDNWIRRNQSKFGTSGPKAPADGDYFAQIDSEFSNRDSTLKINFSKPAGVSCIKFRHHLYGDYSKELKFGYFVSSGILTVLNMIDKKENFWGCSTVFLSDLPSQAQGIFFQAETGENAFSIIALDSITFINLGNECNKVSNCPVPKPPPTTTTKQPSTVTPTDKTSGSSNELWYIIGGACGGVVLLAIIIIILCILKRSRSKRDIPSLPSASFLNSPNSRQLPAIPCDQNISNGSIMSIAESYDRKFSIQPTPDPIMLKNDEVWKNDHVQTHPTDPIMLKNDEVWENEHVLTESDNNRVASTDYTDILETSPVRENKSDLSDYIHVPPDYPNDDETSQKDYLVPEEEKQSNEEDENTKIEHNEIKKEHIYMNEPDDDYLEPINALGESIRAPDNQYESDPTDKGNKNKTSPVNLCVAPFTEEHLEIPQIPVMHREKYHLNAAENKEDTDNDYDDAATALNGYTTENNDQDELYDNSRGEQDTNSIKSDKEDYLYMTENRKDEDCVKPTKDSYDNSKGGQDNNSVNSDKEDYFDMSENQKDEDYVKPTIDTS
ncbi:uncharacterized protein LOC143072933 [Mytilus galloprovincialis]|uniref:uncharacterized protein LOC143072933 n=1 Tax=Mytilus galloprovincialis TaxID=29158 RepID=UPI003F7B536E